MYDIIVFNIVYASDIIFNNLELLSIEVAHHKLFILAFNFKPIKPLTTFNVSYKNCMVRLIAEANNISYHCKVKTFVLKVIQVISSSLCEYYYKTF